MIYEESAKIPKKIHYCWLSGEKMHADAKRCIKTWKKQMPDYELVLWDSNRFDINSHIFVKESCKVKKWAFASDYIRLYALYTEGGIYLDTDVYVRKSFNEFLENGFFTGIEYYEKYAEQLAELLNEDGTLKNKTGEVVSTHGIQIQAAVMGGVKGHPFLKSCMEWYDNRHFILEDGTYLDKIISPDIYAHIAAGYGFRYKNELQKLKFNMTIYPNTIFSENLNHCEKDCYAIHLCSGAWREKSFWLKIRENFTLSLRRNNFLRALFGKRKIGVLS
ncbi:MAG: hypothetical protein LBI42_01575 [Chitinispirillales bacterium]|jgi:hypothetical protein|nr:hypothetical protein [Chitinispirillales bacterium]